ncbi:hypothetical protein MBAV_001939 [Candidatus Magnetobacterium bavaricum]|uniref:DUF3999 family protein n=1 Tax=Candidatus Magnetobacterium bavaricum TaxID=29290 RepID=A0A0F3GVI9_9BACT|nr:hypothetical protein MBAV_001939 [Candidatus Magnetobacterium bavaricum]
MIPAGVVALTPADFQYNAEIKYALKPNTLYRIHLTPEILDKCSPNCNDLRLLDADNNEVPYVILQDILPADKVETYALQITHYEAGDTRADIVMKMPDKYKPVSTIELSIADSDFNKKAVLYASRNGTDWDFITQEGIYDFTSQVDLRKTNLQFNASDYPLYRLILTDADMTTEGSQQTIHLKYDGLDFSAFGVKNKKVRINAVKASTTATTQQRVVYDKKVFSSDLLTKLDDRKNTVVAVDSAVPASSATLETSNPYYHRKVDVYYAIPGQKTDSDSYALYATHYVYSFPSVGQGASKDYFDLPPNPGRKYKFVVNNANNPPLIVKSVELNWVKRYLFFVSLKDSDGYVLCFGGSGLPVPQYDLASFVNQNSYFERPFESVGPVSVVPNARYKPPSQRWSQRVEKAILTVVVVVLVVLIGLWIYRLSAKVPWR